MVLIRQRVNIHKFPAVENVPLGARIVKGDLHANAVTVLFMLVKEGIASNITSSQYDEFVQLSEKGGDALSAEDLRRFYQIMDYLVIRKGISILLLGDEVVDRAENPDLFPVEVFVKLVKNDVVLTILVSNHGIELLDRSEKRRPFSETRFPLPYSKSAHQLQKLIDRGLVNREEFEHTLDSFYKPCLKVLAYAYDGDKTFFLYSHARIGLGQIERMAKEFNCIYPGYGIEILAWEIDCINDKFQTHLKNRQAHLLYTYERLGHDSGAIDFVIWNRDRKNLERPETLDGYKLRFVHGHDSSDKDKDPVHVINLDGLLGKAPHLNEEEYSILVQITSVLKFLPHSYETTGDCNIITDADEASYDTGRKLLSWEREEDVNLLQTSAASRLSSIGSNVFPIVEIGLRAISSYWGPVKQSKSISHTTIPPLVVGPTFMSIMPEKIKNTAPPILTLSQVEPLEQSSRDCEGEQTRSIDQPHIEPDLLARLDGNLMLGGIIWHLAKQGYAWLTGAVEDNPNPLAAGDLLDTKTESVRPILNELRENLRDIERWIIKKRLDNNFLLAKDEIQLRLTELEEEMQVSQSSLDEIRLDIFCLEKDIKEAVDLDITALSNAGAVHKNEKNVVHLKKMGLFASNQNRYVEPLAKQPCRQIAKTENGLRGCISL